MTRDEALSELTRIANLPTVAVYGGKIDECVAALRQHFATATTGEESSIYVEPIPCTYEGGSDCCLRCGGTLGCWPDKCGECREHAIAEHQKSAAPAGGEGVEPTKTEVSQFAGELWGCLVNALPFVLEHSETEDHHALVDFSERLKCSNALSLELLRAAVKHFPKMIARTDAIPKEYLSSYQLLTTLPAPAPSDPAAVEETEIVWPELKPTGRYRATRIDEPAAEGER